MKKELLKKPKQSEEEKWVEMWLKQLKKEGYVESYHFEEESFELYPKLPVLTKFRSKTDKEVWQPLHKQIIYTPDFKVYWTHKARNVFFSPLLDCTNGSKDFLYLADPTLPVGQAEQLDWFSYFEVKPDNFDQHNTKRFFISRTQPEMYEKFGKWISLVTPFALFNRTFTPDSLFTELTYKKGKNTGQTKTGKPFVKFSDLTL